MTELMKATDWQDLAKRALWTFAQAFVAVVAVSNEPFSTTVLAAGVAAGLSAVKTLVLTTRK